MKTEQKKIEYFWNRIQNKQSTAKQISTVFMCDTRNKSSIFEAYNYDHSYCMKIEIYSK